MNDKMIIETTNIDKFYKSGKLRVQALKNVSVNIKNGEFTAVVGPSGSGKTTFLNLVGALDSPSSGKLQVLGHDLAGLKKKARADLRLHSLGFVFQAYNLIPVLTARENVEFVLELQGMNSSERQQRAEQTLAEVGLSDFADRRPNELSGGQQQRVAVARAVASRPALVLADEPTANLDGTNAESLLDMMRKLNQEYKITFLFSTHDPRVISHACRVITLEDGRVAADDQT